MTQNQNESINHVLWNRCPNTKFCGLSKITLAVVETVSNFNKGSGSDLSLHHAYGIQVSSNTINTLKSIDHTRIMNAAKKITAKYRLNHGMKCAKSKSKSGHDTCKSYKSGSFGTRTVPETIIDSDINNGTSSSEPDITFCNEIYISMIHLKV